MSARAWLEMGLLGCIWGASFLSNRVALHEVGVATTVAVRVVGACAVLWIVVWRQGLPVPRQPWLWAAFLLMGLLGNAVPFSLITWGQLTIPSGLAAILNASTALMGVIVAALAFRDERLTPRKMLGVAAGFAGVVTVIGPASLANFDPTSLAQIAILGAALSYALSGAFARFAARGLAPEVAAAGMLTGASVIMGPAALILDGLPRMMWSPEVWGALGYLAVVSTAFAYLIFYRLLRMAGAGNTSLVTLLVAPIAILLGAVVLSEALPLRAFGGFGLLALGLLILDGRLARGRRADSMGKPAE
ncbi:DMT family transporter [Rubellimicrobium arenae]|uniref:DMT family transporter n=1 Tax=Rubellimicrobium arenae TaxID=2817372 RepID=UPI001FF02587|nr:DMT family transporter [Rubellimicrobium arenae]